MARTGCARRHPALHSRIAVAASITVRRAAPTGGDATGGDATGGDATGNDATGGVATGSAPDRAALTSKLRRAPTWSPVVCGGGPAGSKPHRPVPTDLPVCPPPHHVVDLARTSDRLRIPPRCAGRLRLRAGHRRRRLVTVGAGRHRARRPARPGPGRAGGGALRDRRRCVGDAGLRPDAGRRHAPRRHVVGPERRPRRGRDRGLRPRHPRHRRAPRPDRARRQRGPTASRRSGWRIWSPARPTPTRSR